MLLKHEFRNPRAGIYVSPLNVGKAVGKATGKAADAVGDLVDMCQANENCVKHFKNLAINSLTEGSVAF